METVIENDYADFGSRSEVMINILVYWDHYKISMLTIVHDQKCQLKVFFSESVNSVAFMWLQCKNDSY